MTMRFLITASPDRVVFGEVFIGQEYSAESFQLTPECHRDRLYSLDITNAPEDARCETRFYGVPVDKVDAPPEEIFEEKLKVHIGVEGAPPLFEFDQNIDIAILMLLTPDEGSKDPDPPNAEAPDPFAVFRQRTEDAVSRKHVSYSCYPPIRITLFPRVAGRRGVPAGATTGGWRGGTECGAGGATLADRRECGLPVEGPN